MRNLLQTGSFMVAFAVAPMFLGAAWAQDKSGVNATEMAAGDGGVIAQLSMAQDLYPYSLSNEDALAALTAARITQSVDTKVVEREVETKPTEGVEVTEEGKGVDAPAGAEEMLTSAEEFAGGDPSVMGLVEDAHAQPPAGRQHRPFHRAVLWRTRG